MPSAADRRDRFVPGDTRHEIELADAAWMRAVAGGDATALEALYTADATVLPPGAEVLHGRDAVVAYLRSPRAAPIRQTVLLPLEVTVAGNIAYEIAGATSTVLRHNRPPAVDTGRVLTVWRRESDGAWRIKSSMWHSTLPASPLG